MLFNLVPAYRGTGGWIKFISADWREVHIRLRLSIVTRNYVGTIFGGSMFSATDPFYMIMLMKNLGKHYVVWDKSSSIRYLRPGKKVLHGRFLVTQEVLDEIKEKVAVEGEYEKDLIIELINTAGKVSSSVVKHIYIADKSFYKEKRRKKEAQV